LSPVAPDGVALAAALAQHIAPAEGVGLALLGPLAEDLTFIGLHGPLGGPGGEIKTLAFRGRNYQDNDYIRRWMVIQGLDWVRRLLLGQMESPADWR
jgi:hypothetical protein